jgi:hypothetical protein
MLDAPFTTIDRYGQPWHGLCVGGTITTGTGINKTGWTQPAGGAVDVVRVPGTPACDVTESGFGYQWRDYALISGSTKQVYGKSLNASGTAWLYCQAVANVYKLELSSVSLTGNSSGGAFSCTVTARPYRLVRPDESAESTRSISVSLSDIGQGQWSGADTTFSAVLATQSETGGKVILAVTKSNVPVGWLMLTTTGTTLAGLSVVASVWQSRAETLIGTLDVEQSGSEANVTATGVIAATQCNVGEPVFYTNTWGAWSGDRTGGDSVYYCAPSYTRLDTEIMEYVFGAGFSGETAIPMRAVITRSIDQDWAASSTVGSGGAISSACDGGPTVVTWTTSVSGTQDEIDKIEIFAGATLLGSAGMAFSYTGSVTHNMEGGSGSSLAGETSADVSATRTRTWTSFDGTTSTLESGSYSVLPTHKYAPVVSVSTSDTTTAETLHARFTDYFYLATPLTDDGKSPVWKSFSGDLYMATIRPINPKLAIGIEDVAGTFSGSQAFTPYNAHSLSLSLGSWAAQANIKGSHQPATNAIDIHASTGRCWV